MQKIRAFFFNVARTIVVGREAPHNDNLRAGQFNEDPPFSIYRAMIGG